MVRTVRQPLASLPMYFNATQLSVDTIANHLHGDALAWWGTSGFGVHGAYCPPIFGRFAHEQLDILRSISMPSTYKVGIALGA